MANVLVTGGGGLIGWQVVDQLVESGHAVTVLDKFTDLPNLAHLKGRVEIVAGDVTDLTLLLQIAKSRRIERIVHLAAFIAHESVHKPADSVIVNVQGLTNVLELSAAFDVARVVWASSVAAVNVGAEYDGMPRDETFTGQPRTTYGIAKTACENIAGIYRNTRGVDAVAIRPPLAYGIGRLVGRTGDFNAAVRNVALGRPAKFDFEVGSQAAQLIYNRDMARLFITALFHDGPVSPVYNTPVVRNVQWAEVQEILERLVPGSEIANVKRPGGESSSPLFDGVLARKELGFEPEWTVERSLAEMIDHYRQLERENPAG